MTSYALLFEAKSIQSYLFSSGRLRDIIGASELVDDLTRVVEKDNKNPKSILDRALDALGIKEKKSGPLGQNEIAFSRRAGGAFYAIAHRLTLLEELRDLFTLLVQQIAPDLDYEIAIGQGDDDYQAYHDARQKLKQYYRKNTRLPLAAPIAMRFRRTGRAVEHKKKGDRDLYIDAATQAKKRYADLSRAEFIKPFSVSGINWKNWPSRFDCEDDSKCFPFLDENRNIALLHIDGNGLGQLLRKVNEAVKDNPDNFIEIFRTLSKSIEGAMQKAAQLATKEVLMPEKNEREKGVLAARPVLLGGDDLTLLIRSDLAIPFLITFAKNFEKESQEALEALKELKKIDTQSLPKKLTVGAGLVFMQANQPFYIAVHLVEELMARAKKRAKSIGESNLKRRFSVKNFIAKKRAKSIGESNPPSSVGLYRITSSLTASYEQIVQQELSHWDKGRLYINTLETYFIGGDQKPQLSQLEKLADLLNSSDFSRGPIRQLMTLIGLSLPEARTRYRRWRQLMQENHPEQFKSFEKLMRSLGGEMIDDLPYFQKIHRSPIGDALSLMAISRKE